jgi:hypothetical protein
LIVHDQRTHPGGQGVPTFFFGKNILRHLAGIANKAFVIL